MESERAMGDASLYEQHKGLIGMQQGLQDSQRVRWLTLDASVHHRSSKIKTKCSALVEVFILLSCGTERLALKLGNQS